MSLLVVSAIEAEAKPALAWLQAVGLSHEYFALGIGPLDAARNEALLQHKARDRSLLYLGSCGSYAAFEQPYLVTISSAYFSCLGERLGECESPEGLYPMIELSPNPKIELPRRNLLCAPGISLNANLKNPDRFGSSELLVENMELYCCAKALNSARKATVILGVTNEIGAEARKAWRENYAVVAKMSAEYLAKHIEKIL